MVVIWYIQNFPHLKNCMNKNSVVLTASDAGWINGHTYALFSPSHLEQQLFYWKNHLPY